MGDGQIDSPSMLFRPSMSSHALYRVVVGNKLISICFCQNTNSKFNKNDKGRCLIQLVHYHSRIFLFFFLINRFLFPTRQITLEAMAVYNAVLFCLLQQ